MIENHVKSLTHHQVPSYFKVKIKIKIKIKSRGMPKKGANLGVTTAWSVAVTRSDYGALGLQLWASPCAAEDGGQEARQTRSRALGRRWGRALGLGRRRRLRRSRR